MSTCPGFCRPTHQEPHLVYRLFDAEGALLYVGLTRDMDLRLRGHLNPNNVHHGADVIQSRYASHTTEEHPDYHAAHDAEIAAIYAEMPELNRQHNHQAWRWVGKPGQWVPVEQVSA